MSQNELEFSALHNGKVLVDMKVGGVSVGRFEINPEETSTIARKALVAARVIQDNSGKPLRDPESINGLVSEVPISGLGIGPKQHFFEPNLHNVSVWRSDTCDSIHDRRTSEIGTRANSAQIEFVTQAGHQTCRRR